MTAAHEKPVFKPSTGFSPIDMLSFGRQPNVSAHLHETTDVILLHMNPAANEGRTCVEADGSQWDTLTLARGHGRPISGHVGGKPFHIPPHTNLRACFAPRGMDAAAEFCAVATSINLMFPPGYLDSMIEGIPHHGFRPIGFEADERLIRLTHLVETEILNPGFASRLMVEGLTRAIAANITGRDNIAAVAADARIYLTPAKLRRVIEFVEANLDRNIGLEDLARVAELSLFHFSRVFKLSTGLTPYHYIRDRRLERSRMLLGQNQLSLAELALACGFANQSHFTAAFTKAMGIPPGRFRRHSA